MQVLCTSGVEVDAFMYSSADGLVMVIFGGRYRMAQIQNGAEWFSTCVVVMV